MIGKRVIDLGGFGLFPCRNTYIHVAAGVFCVISFTKAGAVIHIANVGQFIATIHCLCWSPLTLLGGSSHLVSG